MKFEELLVKDSKFKDLVEKVGGNLITKKNAFKKQNDFIITNDKVKKIKLNNIISYTMAIKRNNATDNLSFENLVIQEEINTNPKAYILKYTPNNIILSEDQLLNFEGEIQMNRLEKAAKFNNNKPQNRTTESECFVYVDQLWCSAPYQGSTQHHLPGASCQVSTLYLRPVKVLTPDACGSTGGGGTSGSTGSDGGFGDPYGTGGGGGYDNSDYPTEDTYTENYQQYITTPVLSAENSFDIKNTGIFYNSISLKQQQWAIDNPYSYNQIIQYQIDNEWSDESKIFANFAIKFLIENPDAKFDDAKYKLIAEAIEDQIDDSDLDSCTKGVLDKLKISTEKDISKMINRFYPASSVFNINMSTGQVTNPNDLAQTTKVNGSSTDINMVFNGNYIIGLGNPTRPTDLSVATTMAHEIIHAYLISLLEENKTYGTLGIYDFPTIYDAYVQQQITKNPNILPEAHHELIAEKYLFVIASTIEEFHTGTYTDFPRQVYLDMAWGGLVGTDIFNKNYPNDSNHKNFQNRERIFARINTEKIGSQYGINTPIGTPCK